jgi:hypothetical protein
MNTAGTGGGIAGLGSSSARSHGFAISAVW